MTAFIDEAEAYGLLECAGMVAPRRALVQGPADLEGLRFQEGEAVVFKGIVRGAWHKSDLGLVRFGSFDRAKALEVAGEMQRIGAAHGEWAGLLVVEKVAYKSAQGLPSEALVALRRSPEAGWVAVLGLGGLHANSWGREIAPLLWPLAFTEPGQALEELKAHYLGRVWLGSLRQGEALTSEPRLLDYLTRLWRLAELLEARQIGLLEMNPVVIDPQGRPMALDGVGEGRVDDVREIHRPRPAQELHRLLVKPRRIAVAGISSHEGSPGRVILENLQRSTLDPAQILPIKPGEREILGLACLPGVDALLSQPADQLVLSLPASKALRMIEQLCEQGGGAELVYLVSGGLGDGADASGRGARLEKLLSERRSQGLWTPSIVGPNGVGFLSSEGALNTLFITHAKLPFETRGGALALVSQSGAFLLACLSKAPSLPLRYGISIGNQLDVRLSEFLRALAWDDQLQVIACYVEGFRPGDLLEVARATQELARQGKRVLLYKGGRSEAGQAAASSHTGALAGDWQLQRSLLRRAGAILPASIGEFDAAMAWLAASPQGKPAQVAILTNAGFEAVVSADLFENGLSGYALKASEQDALRLCLAEHGLEDLVAPHLPLDLTPMAGERAFLDATRILAHSAADTVVVGLVPFTQYLDTQDEERMAAFADALRVIASESGKRLGVAVDSGTEFEAYRHALMLAGLPVFASMERALAGLRVIAEP